MQTTSVTGTKYNRGPIDVDKVLGERIKSQREKLGLTQSDLGRSIGKTFQQVQKYEKGANRVAVSTLLRIAPALGKKPEFFIKGLVA